MAGFTTHISISTLAGGLYGLAGYQTQMPLESCIISAGLCSVSGMLPDLDSDSGVPLREITTFSAAVAPMLMLGKFQAAGISQDWMVIYSIGIYLAIRFGLAEFFRRFTVHRGMWHSLPASAAVGLAVYLIQGGGEGGSRIYVSMAVVLGFISHLILDEMWSVDYRGGRYVYKSSFGTAMKLWGNDRRANWFIYGVVGFLSFLLARDLGILSF